MARAPQRSAEAARTVPYHTLVNLGFCGALDAQLQVGSIVVGDAWLQPRTSYRHFTGPIASISHIAQTAFEKRQLRDTGALAVEMEVAGLAGLPCYCIKSVSDLADESFANDLNAVLNLDGRMNIPKLLTQRLSSAGNPVSGTDPPAEAGETSIKYSWRLP